MLERLSRKALLSALRREGVISASQERAAIAHWAASGAAAQVPWFVTTLHGLGGWVSACLVLLAMFLMFGVGGGIFAAPLCWIGLLIERRGKRSPFFLQAALSLVLVGAGLAINLTGTWLVDYFGDRGQGTTQLLWSMAFVVVSVVLCYLSRNGLVRGIMLSMAFTSSIFGLSVLLPEIYFNAGASVGLLICMTGWVWLILEEPRHRYRLKHVYAPLVGALLCTSFVGLAVELEMRGAVAENTQHLWILSTGLIGLMSLVLHRVFVDMALIPSSRQGILIQGSGIVIATCLSLSPGTIFSLVLGLVAMHSGSRRLLGMALILLIGFLAQFYYALEFSFLLKSGTLAGAGVLMLLVARRLHKSSAK